MYRSVADRVDMIIKVGTNTSDSIKSELIVIKRNGASAGATVSRRSAGKFFANIIGGQISSEIAQRRTYLKRNFNPNVENQ